MMATCGHCDDRLRKGETAGACPIHGQPGVTLPRGVKRCTLCASCYRQVTADAPPEPIIDTRPRGPKEVP